MLPRLLNGSVLTARGFRARVADPGRSATVAGDALLGTDDLRRLRTAGWVGVDAGGHAPDRVAATTAGLALAGVPVTTLGLPADARALLPAGLLEIGDTVGQASVADPGAREQLSLRLRRVAQTWFGHRIPGDPEYPRAAVVVDELAAVSPERATQLLGDVHSQTWGCTSVLVLRGDDDAATVPDGRWHRLSDRPGWRVSWTTSGVLADDLARIDPVYLARVRPGLRYGPHHLEDLVRALAYSGADVVHAPARFHRWSQGAALLERLDLPIETEAEDGRGRLAGASLWYAADGAEEPSGSGYLSHGANVVPDLGADAVEAHRLAASVLHLRPPEPVGWVREVAQEVRIPPSALVESTRRT